MSDWNSGQSSLTTYSKNNVVAQADGSYDFVLNRSAKGSSREVSGGEMQSNGASTTGTWNWLAQAPDMVDGAVFAMFLFQDDYLTQPWREYDFEFAGEDTSQVHLAVHFENAAGEHVRLKEKVVIDLGFDASKGRHLYSITVTDKDATFLVDGVVVAKFDASSMQESVWDSGPLASVMDIWAAPHSLSAWAGKWTDPGRALVGTIDSITLPTDSVRLGNNHDNSLIGSSAADVLYGNAGNDYLDGKGGADQMFGGTGNDVYVVDNASDVTREYASAGTDTVRTALSWKLASNFENLTLQGTRAVNGTGNGLNNKLVGNDAANKLEGSGGADSIFGNGGKDVLYGGAGADTLDGGSGADVLSGGSGNDLFVFTSGSGADTVTGFAAGGTEDVLQIASYAKASALRQVGADTLIVLSSSDSVLLKNVDASDLTAADFRYGASHSFPTGSIKGTKGADTLNGTAKGDKIYGLGGNDVINGKAGNDTMYGGAGNDAMWVSSRGDRMIEEGNGGTDTVHATISWTLAANIENLSLRGSATTSGTGNKMDNRITGNNSDNVLKGADGNDTLIGNGGSDTLHGGAGNDAMWVSSRGDRTIEEKHGGIDTVHTTISWTLAANIENLSLRGSGAISGTGNNMDNRITGNSSNNIIKGADGNDTLIGNDGSDRLSGGRGNDVFVFNKGDGADHITDFTAGGNYDRMQISGYSNYDELRQVGDDTLVLLSDTDSIRLHDVVASTLTSDDFLFLG